LAPDDKAEQKSLILNKPYLICGVLIVFKSKEKISNSKKDGSSNSVTEGRLVHQALHLLIKMFGDLILVLI